MLGGSGLFTAARLEGDQKWVAVGLTAAAVVLYAAAAAVFWGAFPSSYVWSELLISYEGGFVRRGLLGEIAYLLHPFVSTQAFLTVLFFAVYVASAARVIYLACVRLNYGALLFVVSPVALTFPLNDPAAFARKDALIVGAFLAALYVIERLPRRPFLAFTLTALIYAVLGLVHELGWLYFPLSIAFLLNTSGLDLPRARVLSVSAVAVLLILAAATLSTLFKGNAALEAQMVAAWQEKLPEAFDPLLAADYLSEGILLNVAFVYNLAFDGLIIAGYAVAAFLGGVAVVGYAIDRRPSLAVDPLRVRLTRYAVYCMIAALAIAADWGRVIHLFWMHAFVFLASLPPSESAPARPVFDTKRDPRGLFYGLALLFLSAVTWRLAHSGLRANPLLPGYIFDLQPLYRSVFGLHD